MAFQKKRPGDRKDAWQVRDLDGLHFIMPLIYPNRADNEAFIMERVDLTNARAYLDRKNAEKPAFHYTIFQLITAAILKTVYLRPKMNRFIANKTLYQRSYLSAAFVVKNQFADNGSESLAFFYADGKTTLEDLHEKIRKLVTEFRAGHEDQSSDVMDLLVKMPHFISRAIVRFLCFLDRHGWVPQSIIETDPNYSTIFLTNLGSIKLRSGYHHLSNWGTSSLFVIVGEQKKRPFTGEDGSMEMKESIDIGLTIDERIADGYYYSNTIRLFKYLIERPELLELPFETICEELDVTQTPTPLLPRKTEQPKIENKPTK